MGWLHCEPEELFVPKLFGTTDLTTYVPSTIAWLCSPLTVFLQSVADQFNMGSLSEFTFIARPIQVCLMQSVLREICMLTTGSESCRYQALISRK